MVVNKSRNIQSTTACFIYNCYFFFLFVPSVFSLFLYFPPFFIVIFQCIYMLFIVFPILFCFFFPQREKRDVKICYFFPILYTSAICYLKRNNHLGRENCGRTNKCRSPFSLWDDYRDRQEKKNKNKSLL